MNFPVAVARIVKHEVEFDIKNAFPAIRHEFCIFFVCVLALFSPTGEIIGSYQVIIQVEVAYKTVALFERIDRNSKSFAC